MLFFYEWLVVGLLIAIFCTLGAVAFVCDGVGIPLVVGEHVQSSLSAAVSKKVEKRSFKTRESAEIAVKKTEMKKKKKETCKK